MEVRNNMGKKIEMPNYPDVIPKHPDWSLEDYDKHITELEEKAAECDEWPEV